MASSFVSTQSAWVCLMDAPGKGTMIAVEEIIDVVSIRCFRKKLTRAKNKFYSIVLTPPNLFKLSSPLLNLAWLICCHS